MLYNQLAVALTGNTETGLQTVLNHMQMQCPPHIFAKLKPMVEAMNSPQSLIASLESVLPRYYSEAEATSILDMTSHPGWQVYQGKLHEYSLAHLTMLQDALNTIVQTSLMLGMSVVEAGQSLQ